MSCRWIVLALFLGALSAPLQAQEDEGCSEMETEDEDGCAELLEGTEGLDEDDYGIQEDPYSGPPREVDDPRRPPPIQVGSWQPPALPHKAALRLEALRKRRAQRPRDPAVAYALAEFYLENEWYPHAEREMLRCAHFDPESLVPWEKLLKIYRSGDFSGGLTWEIVVGPRGQQIFRRKPQERDWLDDTERARRIGRAYVEILKRRPGDLSRRREYLAHLKQTRNDCGFIEQAQEILNVMPRDAGLRFEVAQAWLRMAVQRDRSARRLTDDKAAALRAQAEEMRAKAVEILELNLRGSPSHAASSLRLAWLIARRDGRKSRERILDLERRGFFYLFVRPELAEVPFSEEAFLLARDLCGPELAKSLYDNAMKVPQAPGPFGRPPTPMLSKQYWELSFPRAQAERRLEIVQRLRRRGDAASAALLVGLLWNLQDVLRFGAPPSRWTVRPDAGDVMHQKIEQAAIDALARSPAVAYPSAERFLKAAEAPIHRSRAVRLMHAIRDPRGVGPLTDALQWDIQAAYSYGVSRVLEELADARAVAALSQAALDVRRPVARRAEAAEALGAFRDPRAVAALSQLAGQKEFRIVAAYGLYRLTGEETHALKLEEALHESGADTSTVRLVAKLEPSPRVEAILLSGLRSIPDPSRASVLALLQERYWKTAEPKVKAIFLKQAQDKTVTKSVLRFLGELGGKAAADRLLQLMDELGDDRWETCARALANTGDSRAVRKFNRMRILSKRPDRRELAEELYPFARKREAQIARAAAAKAG
ncbi:MAG: hypothetical protein O7C98_05925 [Planctomycetota bacterium]|nr:hypothetical protein [Planctomycetota bacterium]